MPTYRVHFATERYAPFPPLESLPQFDAETPLDAVRLALRQPNELIGREEIWARVVVNVLPNGNIQVQQIPLTLDFHIPYGWAIPDDDEPAR